MALSLEPLSIIMYWLLLYPLCEVQELASAAQMSKSIVYRLLADLIRIGWVDVVRHAGLLDSSRSQHYALTSLGWKQLAQTHQPVRPSLSQEGAEPDKRNRVAVDAITASSWNACERRVQRLIPRLPYMARLRRLMLGIFDAAPREQALQGRPVDVRWHWIPDYRYVCRYRERPLTVYADAVLAWHCSAISQGKDTTAAPMATHSGFMLSHHWYSAFVLLETGLSDMTMIRERLRRLLCYRECAERWLRYHAFPPLLVVVEHPHQMECWRRAAHEASAILRVAPIHGAIAVFRADDASMHENPWRWHWHDLATSASCLLRQFLTPGESTALPGGVGDDLVSAVSLLQDQKAHRAALVCVYHTQRSSKPGTRNRPGREKYMQQPVASKREQHWTAREMAHVSMGLGQRHMALLTQLCRYPLLASQEVAAISGLEEASATRYLRELHNRELLCTWVSQVAGIRQLPRWYLSEQGLRLLATIHHVPIQRLSEYSSQEGTASSRTILLPKGLTTLQRYPVHLAGVYGAVAAIFRAADTHGATVAWWEAGGECARSYLYHGVQQNLRPDASFELLFPLQEGDTRRKRVRYWLEWDNGTMGRRDLEAKFQSYARYCQSKAWMTDGLRFLPHLLFIVPDTGQEARVAAAATLVQDIGLHIFVTTAGHVRASGFLSAIWRQVMPVIDRPERRAL